MGAIYGLWLAQYEVLRAHGHSPSEAFNETVEEATQSLYPLIAENGMDWMYANCSTTAQRGALDFFRRIGQIAEDEDHHPDLHLTGYRNVAIELSTHALGGLSENDFILAAKIDQLPVALKQ